jgi:hypothetical protein
MSSVLPAWGLILNMQKKKKEKEEEEKKKEIR